ncbi:MAG: ribonuclease H-like domain-containing protein [Elusimicrobiota bacterium]
MTNSLEKILVFDLETQRGFDEVGGRMGIPKMGMSVGVVYDYQTDKFTAYLEKDAQKLIAELLSSTLVVGFNLLSFDYPVLSAYSEQDLQKIKTLDMMRVLESKLGFRPKLNDLVSASLGAKKSADGLMALQWYREGKLAEVSKYCQEDVRLTKELYEFGRKNGFVHLLQKYGPNKQIEVSW